MKYFRIKKFGRFQHYKDRNPPWIKLHRELLTSQTWVGMDDTSRVLAVACMLLAAATDNKIPLDEAYIKRVAYLNKKPDINPLLKIGFVEIIDENGETLADASTMHTNARPETETETETENTFMSGKAPDASSLAKKINQDARDVLDFLNRKTGRSYQPVDANLAMIKARLRDATPDECRAVIAKKCREWANDEKMAKYLRPATLFNATKFAQYQGELIKTASPEASHGD